MILIPPVVDRKFEQFKSSLCVWACKAGINTVWKYYGETLADYSLVTNAKNFEGGTGRCMDGWPA